MSTPKSAVKSRKLARKRKRKQEARLRRKRKQRGLREARLCFDAPGGVRMSEVLEEFVRPFEDAADSEETYRHLLKLGVVAWNAALCPEEEQQKKIVAKGLRKITRKESPQAQATCEQVVHQLIERKKSHFARCRRPILDFVLTDLGDGYHLSVISALV